MSSPLPLALAALLLSLAVAGCSYETGRPDDSPSPGDGTTTGDGDGSDDNSGVLSISFEATGPATLEVPFPSLDSCQAPEDWMGSEPTVQGAIPELRNATGDRTGRILALTAPAAGSVSWMAKIQLRPQCQTLRFDPWSVEPDEQDGALVVHLVDGEVTGLMVLVRQVRDCSGEAALWEGNATLGAWSRLEGRTAPAGCG